MTKREATGTCRCCTQPTATFICFACKVNHGKRVSKSCPVYAKAEAADAARVAAIPEGSARSTPSEAGRRLASSLDR